MRVTRIARRLISQAGSCKAVGAKRLRVHGDEILYKEEGGTRKLGIGEIALILESDRNYFLFTADASAVILPKEYGGERDIQLGIIEVLKAAIAELGAGGKAGSGQVPDGP